ncbi:MAG: cupin domain-containing protein, partial [Pseudomonadota bacterium]
DFPAGSYIRNPPESSHTPGSDEGCTIFVKLWQFDMADRTHIRADTNKMRFVPDRKGVEVMPLFSDGQEDVVVERWSSGETIELNAPNGLEVLVLEGGFEESGETFKKHSWLRLPRGSVTEIKVGHNGAKLWIKRDHLKEDPKGPEI